MKTSVMQPQWPYRGRIPDDAECWFCSRPAECRHHVYGGALRKVSEEHGLWVYLCHEHHNLHRRSVHQDGRMRAAVQAACQEAYENAHGREEFMALVGRNYR